MQKRILKNEEYSLEEYEEKKKLYKDKPLKFVIDEFANENNLKVVMHFPHSSLDVPPSFWKDVDIDETYFTKINLKMSDLHLLEIFKDWHYEKVIAPYSRLYVDVEKYWNERKEEMSKYGMGAVYSKDAYGKSLHKKSEEFIIEAKRYYQTHHNLLSKACACKEDVLILDIHSFNYEMARFLTKRKTLPDVCLGVNNDESYSPELVKRILIWNKVNNVFSYKINFPYKGTILPNKRRKGQKIYSLMFEFNKTWYL